MKFKAVFATPKITLLILVLTLFGVLGAIGKGQNPFLNDSGRPLASLDRTLPSTYLNGCHLAPDKSKPLPCIIVADEKKPLIYLVGDSHAAQWVPAFEKAHLSNFADVRFITKSSCPFVSLKLTINCEAWVKNVIEEIRINRPTAVVIANMTNASYFNFLTHNYYSNYFIQQQEMLINEISSYTYVALIEDTPYSLIDTSECLVFQSASNCEFIFQVSLLTLKLKELIEKNHFSYISFKKDLCNKNRCAAGDSLSNWYRDEHHISTVLAKRFGYSLRIHLERIIQKMN